MSRAFTLTVTVPDSFAFTDEILVPDGNDVRFHDLALILRKMAANCEARGPERVMTVSEVAAVKARHAAADAVLAEWEPTADGVSVINGVYSRTFVKNGYSEPVVAVCRQDGLPTIETAESLATWVPAVETQPDA
jgi:hypothetical protein